MIHTYDFLYEAWEQEDLMRQMMQCLSDSQSRCLFTEKLELYFDGTNRTLTVTARDKDDGYACKVIPKRISYRAVALMLKKDFDGFFPGDIRDV